MAAGTGQALREHQVRAVDFEAFTVQIVRTRQMQGKHPNTEKLQRLASQREQDGEHQARGTIAGESLQHSSAERMNAGYGQRIQDRTHQASCELVLLGYLKSAFKFPALNLTCFGFIYHNQNAMFSSNSMFNLYVCSVSQMELGMQEPILFEQRDVQCFIFSLEIDV